MNKRILLSLPLAAALVLGVSACHHDDSVVVTPVSVSPSVSVSASLVPPVKPSVSVSVSASASPSAVVTTETVKPPVGTTDASCDPHLRLDDPDC